MTTLTLLDEISYTFVGAVGFFIHFSWGVRARMTRCVITSRDNRHRIRPLQFDMPKFGQVKCARLGLLLHIRRRLFAALAVLTVAASGCSSYQPAPPPEQTPPTVAAAAPAPKPVAEKITIAENIFFDAGRSTLRPESVAKLDYLVKSVKEIKLEVVLVVGHADPREARGAAQALSEARASAVKTWMVSRGINVGRVYTEGKGAQQPLRDSRTVEGRATNRRAEIEVIGSEGRSPSAAPCPTDKMAKFPWPDPPQPTATDTISRASLLGTDHGKGKSMTDVAARLEAAVRTAGYVNPKLLGVGCDGFAMVLDLEHIQADGTRMADAEGWAPPSQDEDEPGPVSAIKRLFYSPPGRYRQIVFVVSDRPMAQVTAAPTAAKLRTITKDAGHPLPDQFDAVPLTERHVMRVLVYEFAKPSAAKEAQVTPPPGRLGVLVHLKRARLI